MPIDQYIKNIDNKTQDCDVVIVGAGFAGLYLLHSLRSRGFSVQLFETEDDIGGTWYLNRYPGARCDIRTIDYSYSFDSELEEKWQWSEKFASQGEIWNYLNHVAEKYNLRKDIHLSTQVKSAKWREDSSLWHLTLHNKHRGAQEYQSRFLVMATGCLSVPKEIDIPDAHLYTGECYHTNRWPKQDISFKGKRVAVIGTGSSGIQIIPVIAAQADSLTVFQRTPCFALPANNNALSPEERDTLQNNRKEYRQKARMSGIGVPIETHDQSALQVSEQERNERYEHLWENSGIAEAAACFNDLATNPAANETLAEFIRNKIRSIVKNPETAETLCPKDYYVFTKRLCFGNHYYQTYNLPNVQLVDIKQTPITRISEKGLHTSTTSFEFDVLVFALGFDAMTGALFAVDIEGRNTIKLRDKWSSGPRSYLGLMTHEFPNLFTVTGPGSPSVTTNMIMSIEQHVEWISDCITYTRNQGYSIIEPSERAEINWTQYVNDWANLTLFPEAKSWYTGANISGKPQGFMPYIGGLGSYTKICNDVVQQEYLGFSFKGAKKNRYNDDIICPLKPDVALSLDSYKALDIPNPETLSAQEAQALYATFSSEPTIDPNLAECINETFTYSDMRLNYRLYRPKSQGPHPVIVYFHGGGWVLGNLNSDDPFCRYLCINTDSIVISIDYRLAPKFPFPAAIEDAYAAVQWTTQNSHSLKALPNQLIVAGWSAGANIATVVCQMARDLGNPHIAGQLLVNPMTDSDFSRSSYELYGKDYILTESLIRWFWKHYAPETDWLNPKAAPVLSKDLSNLPPTFIATSEYDPLRDEGEAYAKALKRAGTDVHYKMYPGQIHGSLVAVDAIRSSAGARSDMVAAVRSFFHTTDLTNNATEALGV